jgi:hypothetical protein
MAQRYRRAAALSCKEKAFPGCGAARSGAPLIRIVADCEIEKVAVLQRTIPLRSMLRCAREAKPEM